MSALVADGFPVEQVRARARHGVAEAFPDAGSYGSALFGATGAPAAPMPDELDATRLVPPILMPGRMDKLLDLGREPMHDDVDLTTQVGGFTATRPVYVSAFGSTRAAGDLGEDCARQAGRLGLPMVIGENVVPTGGAMSNRIKAYLSELPDGVGGLVVQQSTEDADAEVWNMVHADPVAEPLRASGRLAFELKVGQGAKPGLGGMTVVDDAEAVRIAEHYDTALSLGDGRRLRCASPGTLTAEILRQQVRLMRNNFAPGRVWVKLFGGRDVAEAARIAWDAGADAVTVDGAEGGSGWAPRAFLDHVGLPLSECLHRVDTAGGCLLVSGRIWEGARAVKALASGARAVGLGRAALLATEQDPEHGLERLVECLDLEMRMLIAALGRYSPADLDSEDLLPPDQTVRTSLPWR